MCPSLLDIIREGANGLRAWLGGSAVGERAVPVSRGDGSGTVGLPVCKLKFMKAIRVKWASMFVTLTRSGASNYTSARRSNYTSSPESSDWLSGEEAVSLGALLEDALEPRGEPSGECPFRLAAFAGEFAQRPSATRRSDTFACGTVLPFACGRSCRATPLL